MFKKVNRDYLMKVVNFTQSFSQKVFSRALFGLVFGMTMLVSQLNAQTNPCPLACNNSVQVSMDNDCSVEITPDMMLEGQGTSPICDYRVVVLGNGDIPIPNNPTVGSAFIGKTLKVEVRLGNNSCWGYIHVEDKLPPVIDCPSDVTVDCYATPATTLPTATDNCGGNPVVKELSNIIVDQNCNNEITAIQTIRYSATDASGNTSAVCTRRIAFRKIGIADVKFPLNRDDVEEDALRCDSNPNDSVDADWDDNGDGYPQPEESGVPTTLSGFPIFPNNLICELNVTFDDDTITICESSFKVLRKWTILDWCTGAINTKFQIVKVIDDQGPVLNCPIDGQIIQADPYNCKGTWIVPPPVKIFDCSSTTFTVGYLLADSNGDAPANGVYIDDNVQTITSNGQFVRYEIRNLPVGRTWVRYAVTDACGNRNYCFTEIDVVDNVPPTAVCDQFTVVTLTNNSTTQGVASAFAKTFDDGSHDNCTPVTLDVRRTTPGCTSNNNNFRDRVEFCCQDVGSVVMVELRVKDANGLTNTCMVNVTVQDKTAPTIFCPSNITINCNQNYLDLSITGKATGKDNCGTPIISPPSDNTTPNQCGTGTIRRTFTATMGTSSISCFHEIKIEDNAPFRASDIDWSGIAVKSLDGCMDVDTDPLVTGRPTWISDDCNLVAATHSDQVFTLVDSVCFKILRTWTVIDWCQFNQNNPSAGGTYSRTQVIYLNNKTAPNFTNCGDKSADGFGENCSGYIALSNPATDDCTPTSKIKVTYRIDEGNDGSFGPVRTGTDASGTYPVGTHKIIWIAEDLCGNRKTCDYFFTIVDKKKPTPYCLSEITTVIMPNTEPKQIKVWASDFDKGSFDNCPGKVRLSFSANTNDTMKTYFCEHVGINAPLQMWVTDVEGNSDYCIVRINIQSNGECPNSRIAGEVSTETNEMVDKVKVIMTDNASQETMVQFTNVQGAFQFEGMTGQDYTMAADKNDDYLNGVSTLDMVLIQRHILGLDKFTSPYKYIASDVNNSQSITASDLVELRKLILGITKELPNNDSWRFARSGSQMPQTNPWPFEELIDVNYAGTSVLANNFKAIKIGDVNGTAKANLNSIPVEARTAKPMNMVVDHVEYRSGDIIRVPVQIAENRDMIGFQVGFGYDAIELEFVGVEARQIALTEANLGLQDIDRGLLNVSWNDADWKKVSTDRPLFDIVLKAKSSGVLAQSLIITESSMRAETYDKDFSVSDITLTHRNTEMGSLGVELLQNTPNPFDNNTMIRFSLPNESMATLKIMDITGKAIYSKSDKFSKGMNSIVINSNELQSTGVLYYMLEVNGKIFTKKMIHIKE